MMKINKKLQGRAIIVIMALMMVGWPLNGNSQKTKLIRAFSELLSHRQIITTSVTDISYLGALSFSHPSVSVTHNNNLDLPVGTYIPLDIYEDPILSMNPKVLDDDNDYLFYHCITNPKDMLSKVYHEHFIPQQEIKNYFGSPFVPGIPLDLDSLNRYKYPYNSTFFPFQGIHRNDTILCDSLLAVSHELGSYLKTKSYSEEQLKYLSNVKSKIDRAVTSVNPLVGLNLLSFDIEIADTVFQNEKPEEITQLFQRLNVIINENLYKKALKIMPLKERLKATTNSSSPRQ